MKISIKMTMSEKFNDKNLLQIKSIFKDERTQHK